MVFKGVYFNMEDKEEKKCLNLFEKYIKDNNIDDKYKDTNNWTLLHPNMAKGYLTIGSCPERLFDHCLIFKRKDKSRILVSQPYQKANDIRDAMMQWCKPRGLKCEVSDEKSWHYPSATCYIGLEIDDEAVFLKYIKDNRKRVDGFYVSWIV